MKTEVLSLFKAGNDEALVPALSRIRHGEVEAFYPKCGA